MDHHKGEPVRVREAVAADVAEMVEVHTRARTAYYTAGGVAAETLTGPEERRAGWTRIVEAPDAAAFCARAADGSVAGIMAMGPPFAEDVDARTHRELYQIHVRPDLWRRGVGTALHGTFTDRLAAGGFTGGVVEAWERNARGQAFYARYGWRADGARRPGPGGADYVRMRLALA